MLNAPRVSVVVPAYNHERFVGEALDSVLRQTWQDFEVVVVDDGSSDRTPQIVSERAAADSRIRLIRQANRGSHAAINRGVSESRGPWIAILNSDDRFHAGRLERLLEHCGTQFDFAVTDARLIDGEGRTISDPDHWWIAKVAGFRARARELGPVDGLLCGNYTISTSNFFFRRSLFGEIGPLRHLRHIVDWEYALRAALHAPDRFAYLADETLLDYRLHGGNAILSDTMRGAAEIVHMYRRLLPVLGAPAGAVQSLYLAQRDLRRSWRDRHMAVADGFVRQREADIAQLQSELARSQAELARSLTETARLQDEAAQLNLRLQISEEKLDRFRRSLPGRTYALLRRLGMR